MAAVKNHEADRFLARLPPDIFLYLFFGTDPGLIAERVRNLVAGAVDDPKDPFQLVRILGDELAADPLRLADEANTIPLFGARRAIWIEAQGKAFVNAVSPVLDAPPRDCLIIIEAGALKKDAPLRLLCERCQQAAAIQCYPDTPKDIARLIDAEVINASQTMAPEAKNYLVTQLGQDRLSTRLELEKLMLYTHGAREIQLGDVAAVVSDTSSLLADKAVHAAFDGDLAALDMVLRHVLVSSYDYHPLLASALRHALDLHRARRETGDETNGRGAPHFAGGAFGQREIFDRHLRNWTRASLARVTSLLAETVAKARREPKLGPSLATRALWAIADTARKKSPAQSV